MQHAYVPPPDGTPSDDGLRALAVLVADALARLVRGADPAMASVSGPIGPLVARASADATIRTPRSAKSRHAATKPSGPPDVPDEHAASWQLVASAKAGDGDAFGQLYDG